MYIKVSFESEFNKLMMDLWSIYGKELFNLDGIGEQLDINKFASDFFNSDDNTANKSVDANSNVSEKNVIVFDREFSKPYQRYNSYYLLWKELKKIYGLEIANRLIENQLTGVYYINDFHNIGLSYCYNYSCYDIALMGLPMVNKINSKPPKYFFSYMAQIEQFIVIAGNSTLGATGIADFLIVASYYVKKILDTGKDGDFTLGSKDNIYSYIRELLTSFVYTINQPNRANQSCFTNLSLFDDPFLDNLCPDYKFSDGSADKEIVKELQEIFIDIMNSELRRTPVTFPISTACFSVDNSGSIKDEAFLDFISEKDKEFGFINIYMGDTSTLSSCCFAGEEKFISNEGTKSFDSFAPGHVLKVPTHTGEYKSATVRTYGLQKLYKVILSQGRIQKTIFCTREHNWILCDGSTTDKLNVGDTLLSNRQYANIWTVLSISETGREEIVWCLEVEDNESFVLKDGVITHNCRLRSDMTKLNFNTIGGSSSKIGSIGVVTLNLPRLAYNSTSIKEFIRSVSKHAEEVCRINNAKRHILQKRIDLGAMPLYSLGFMNLKSQFSTVGFTGLYEAWEHFNGDHNTNKDDYINFCSQVLDTINDMCNDYSAMLDYPHNMEQTPSENSAIKLVVKDKYLGYEPTVPFYSNQFMPLQKNCNMLDRVYIQGKLDKKCSGGSIAHLNLDSPVSAQRSKELTKFCAKSGVVYYAKNHILNRCEKGHMSVGSIDKCHCGAKIVDKFTRVVGFLTNVSDWHSTRQKEDFPNREFY